MTDTTYDLIVIGAGPAGYWGAARAGSAGLKTLVVEKKTLGGVCLNEGCIPSKTILNSAKIYDKTRKGEKYGIKATGITYDQKQVLKRKKKVVKMLVAGVRSKLKGSGVEVAEGTARIAGRNDSGYSVEVNDKEFTGKNLLIATGSEPLIPSIPGIGKAMKNGSAVTSSGALDLAKIPESLVVIGGGYIGLEMGSYFSTVGSRVTVVEMLDHIAGETDREISGLLLERCKENGMDFRLNSKVIKIDEGGVVCKNDTREFSLRAETILLSMGRAPTIENLGLETIGVETRQGHIEVDREGRTNQPGVYAAGDVNGRSMLAHTAYREADVCVNNIMGKKDIMRYGAIPSVIYTDPEVAVVGETEAGAEEKGLEFETARLPMNYSGRYVAENEEKENIAKILVEKKHRKLIGIHLIGNYSSEIIYGAAMMIENEMRVKDVREIVFPHPTVSEIIREGVFQL